MDNDEPSHIHKENRFHRYISYSLFILENYNGKEPFHLYLKKYFSANKKHGSGDRKKITSICYHYFRLGLGVIKEMAIEQKIVLSLFLLENKPALIQGDADPEWNRYAHFDLGYKLGIVKDTFSPEKIFPFYPEVSKEVASQAFQRSFLIQPKLFIRIRPGYTNSVFEKLRAADISFEIINNDCLAFNNREKVSDIIKIDKEAVIQDHNSQRIKDFFKSFADAFSKDTIRIWDCCAASGGKSILAFDSFKKVNLTVSDTRKSILENLKDRFAKAGIKKYHSFIADLSDSASLKEAIPNSPFDLIIADVPCSGSGTWSRTPEQLTFFKKENIDNYASLQREIVKNASTFLNENGWFLYITCSVLKKENEDNVDLIKKETGFELIKSEYLKGYEMQADTLFGALFKKPIGQGV